MAESTISSSYQSNYVITIGYTAGSGSITINNIRGHRTDAYETTAWNNDTAFTLYVKENNTTVASKGIKYAAFGKSKADKYWNASAGSEPSSSARETAISLSWSAQGSHTYTVGVSGSPTTNVNNQYFSWTVNGGSSVVKPTLSAVTISGTTATSTSASFSVTNTGGASVTAQGCEFSTTSFGTVVKSFSGTSGSVSGLSPNTTYYARAYATNSAGTGYSAVKSFTTLVGTPTLSAVSLSNVNSSGASASFTVTNTGGASITTSKIQASEAQTFSFVDDTINSTSGTFTRLFPGKLYYVRAMASNGTNTGYSAVTTLGTAPTVTINPSSSSDGTIINLGTSTVGTVSQWYYSLYDGSGNPLVTDATPGQTISGYTFGNNQVTGLTPGVKYGVSLRVTYTQGDTYSTTGTNSGIWYVTTSQPAAVSFSTNGAAFSPKPLYVSINGAAYKLITKDKLNIL